MSSNNDEIIRLGTCGKCHENKDKKCVIDKDIVNEFIEKVLEAEGIILASPTLFCRPDPRT